MSKVSLSDFVRNHQGDTDLTESLVNKFIEGNPPGILSSSESPEYHPAYSAKKNITPLCKAMQAILERQSIYSQDGKISVPAGLTDSEAMKMAQEIYLQKQALTYAYYGIGNCSHRASYAGIKLAKALEKTGVTTRVFAFQKRDQYVVILTVKIEKDKQENFIYDPLTNPEFVYKEDHYKKTILRPCFSKLSTHNLPKLKFNLIIQGSYSERLKTNITEYRKKKINFGSLEELKKDASLSLSLAPIQQGITFISVSNRSQRDHESLLKDALDKLNSRHESLSPNEKPGTLTSAPSPSF